MDGTGAHASLRSPDCGNYDEFGFFKPNYTHVKNNQKKDFAYEDIIHVKKSTHRSNAWGLACLPIAIN
ncbi:MAG: hypothetical protein M0P45_07815, partial [Candidatus Cloacimonas sp.]|nr:hypothetical protein [Candidatus Cloacimonas sp.]